MSQENEIGATPPQTTLDVPVGSLDVDQTKLLPSVPTPDLPQSSHKFPNPEPVVKSEDNQAAPSITEDNIARQSAFSTPVQDVHDDAPRPSSKGIATVAPPNHAHVEDSKLARASYNNEAQPDAAQDAAQDTEQQLPAVVSNARLPRDRVGILEDRIKQDSIGDLDAWYSLIDEHKRRHKLDELRNVYRRYFDLFPSDGDQLNTWLQYELDLSETATAHEIFGRIQPDPNNLKLMSTYLAYVRRTNDLNSAAPNDARQAVTKTFDFVFNHVGLDKDAGHIWQEYIQFLKTAPGRAGQKGWEDQQKMDLLRRGYQRAVSVPNQATIAVWKEYEKFETEMHRQNGRKILVEKSPAYMEARAFFTVLSNRLSGLDRSTVPRLPPLPGYAGHKEYVHQLNLWKEWVALEKADPLKLMSINDITTLRRRILHVYTQAVHSLRFWPQMWFEAAEFCYENDMKEAGDRFMNDGLNANPSSPLLAIKRAEAIELKTADDRGEGNVADRQAEAVREAYKPTLDALYDLIEKSDQREKQRIDNIDEEMSSASRSPATVHDEDDEIARRKTRKAVEDDRKARIASIKTNTASEKQTYSQLITSVWIALLRAIRRTQGQGNHRLAQGMRGLSAQARKRGHLTGEFFTANALLEYHCYKDDAAYKLFDKGVKFFQEDAQLVIEMMKYLIAINDFQNVQATFETSLNRFPTTAEGLAKTRPIWIFYRDYQIQYGDLVQVRKLEQRMRNHFPDDPKLEQFATQPSPKKFDPFEAQVLISPMAQMKPDPTAPDSHSLPSAQNSPRPAAAPQFKSSHSPKRPLEDSETENTHARKIQRTESPFKGGGSRRNEGGKRNFGKHLNGNTSTPPVVAKNLVPPAIINLLGKLPRTELYGDQWRFDALKVVDTLNRIDVSNAADTRKQQQQQANTTTYTQPAVQPTQYQTAPPYSQSMMPSAPYQSGPPPSHGMMQTAGYQTAATYSQPMMPTSHYSSAAPMGQSMMQGQGMGYGYGYGQPAYYQPQQQQAPHNGYYQYGR